MIEGKRDNNFTELQLKGVDLTFTLMKRKFPWIIGWKFFSGYKRYDAILYLDIDIDQDDLTSYVQEEFPSAIPKKITASYKGAFLSDFFGPSHSETGFEIKENYFFKLQTSFERNLNKIYSDDLPESLQITYGSNRAVVKLGVNQFF